MRALPIDPSRAPRHCAIFPQLGTWSFSGPVVLVSYIIAKKPQAVEEISFGMPGHKQNGKPLVCFAGYNITLASILRYGTYGVCGHTFPI